MSSFLHQSLASYEQSWLQQPFFDDDSISKQYEHLQRFYELLAQASDPFARTTRPGHVTGSAFVIDMQMQRVLLTLHAKLNLWLQLGGHADAGQQQVQEVARREAHEESGLEGLFFFDSSRLFPRLCALPAALPFDIDIHQIPALGTDSAHLHYDISYIMVAPQPEPLARSSESLDLRWFSWEEALNTGDPSVQRAVGKLLALRNALRTGMQCKEFSGVL